LSQYIEKKRHTRREKKNIQGEKKKHTRREKKQHTRRAVVCTCNASTDSREMWLIEGSGLQWRPMQQ